MQEQVHGTQTLIQKGSEYDATKDETEKDTKYEIEAVDAAKHYELTVFRDSNYYIEKVDKMGTNGTSQNLAKFIESVRDNRGYYIARYEASFGSGDQPVASKINTEEYITNQKPLSKKSTLLTRASNTETLRTGILWNYINQGDAAKVCKNMYKGNEFVESDLVNSYMWDTAIVYIQAMGNINYANATRGTNTTLFNTGETGDEKCHIFDMAGNTIEWSTEYTSYSNYTYSYPCSARGGYCSDSNFYVAYRYHSVATHNAPNIGFRPGMYVK